MRVATLGAPLPSGSLCIGCCVVGYGLEIREPPENAFGTGAAGIVEIKRIALVTDFGSGGPYTGQMELSLAALAPDVPVVELVSDLPAFRPDLAAYLLPALVRDLPASTLYLCVVDPGVGGERAALVVQTDGNWFVGPDNGLFAMVVRQARRARVLRVDWRPQRLSESFHGRDLFAPIAAKLARGEPPAAMAPLAADALVGADWPLDLPCILHVDGYGNLITGLRAVRVHRASSLRVGKYTLGYARTFCEVPRGAAFWYEDAFGLVELAVNQGRADQVLGVDAGHPIEVLA